MSDSLFESGLGARRSVLGDEYVARSQASATEFTQDFQDLITRYAWGEIWSRPGLSPKVRSMLTIAMLVALGRWHELRLHIRATRNTGVSRDEVKEILMHAAIYAGLPSANAAFHHAAETYSAMDEEAIDGR